MKRIGNFRNYLKEDLELPNSIELSGKYSFFNFVQIVGNHDYHFVYSEYYTNLYKYLYYFVAETIKDNETFIEVFQYKSSLKMLHSVMVKLRQNKLSFFFGINKESILRYGILDHQSKRSHVCGEFKVNDKFFDSAKNYKALEFLIKYLKDINIRKISLIKQIKQEFEKFYPSKKSKKVQIVGKNMIISHFDRHKFTDEELSTNRPFRVLHEWISKKDWRGGVHYYVNETENELEFIIIVH